eukprot:COSAG02_NODE_1375_length_13001_cov_3.495272_10_plen_112_part_00
MRGDREHVQWNKLCIRMRAAAPVLQSECIETRIYWIEQLFDCCGRVASIAICKQSCTREHNLQVCEAHQFQLACAACAARSYRCKICRRYIALGICERYARTSTDIQRQQN